MIQSYFIIITELINVDIKATFTPFPNNIIPITKIAEFEN